MRPWLGGAWTLLLFLSSPAWGDETLTTRFCAIHCGESGTLSGFAWRITGQKPTPAEIPALTQKRVDELVERVEDLLDMYPSRLHFDIILVPRYTGGEIAFYSHKTRSITVAVDRVTDGVLAHEIAHAVICHYFPVPPPERTQEILAQYVDRHLWEQV